ncbi:putative glycoside hydrolase family 43 protein [Daldinia childiae]|uniref:putative glycoside hydrolase family 43 protein n=1 Tax=Daldinia childiae TaxID=326645 RepID=UPI00144543F8|nr:putative glycoside hydrolase family 43 protein [Daldinia childiae]KAF3067193.1 putative glycoside hydrolase family 43 protein [Daldinia childiae]
MFRFSSELLIVAFAWLFCYVAGQSDNLGLKNGYITIKTANFNAKIVRDAQVLASLSPTGNSFDFLPFDLISARAGNGQYHWGDITYRYREDNDGPWIDGDSAASRKVVTTYKVGTGVLASSNLAPTLPGGGPLNVTREWIDVSGDLGLRFTIENSGASPVEIGSLGFPAEFNSIFTNRAAGDTQRLCSLSDPYVGMHAGYIRVSPVRGTGAALVVTPLGDTPLEAYRNLAEPSYQATAYGSQTFEGFYEWQVLSRAWAEKEWAGVQSWNAPSSKILQPGQTLQFGVRFSVAKGGVRDIDETVRKTGTPVAYGVPGYIIPRGSTSQLFLSAGSNPISFSSEPVESLAFSQLPSGSYGITPSPTFWGRSRLTIDYEDGKTQTIHYYVTKSGTEAIGDLGRFLATKQWFNDTSDPFGRAPSVMSYDYETSSIVTQDPRVWIAGLSDEGGVGAYLAAMAKQVIQPDPDELSKLEMFIDKVLWGTIQTKDFSVRKSVFYYEPSVVPKYTYNSAFDWSSWTSWKKDDAYAIDRAYDYVHVAAAYWSLYRVARAYPGLVKSHDWKWYINQAYSTVIRGMQSDVVYNDLGLMGETIFGEILTDLTREGLTTQVNTLTKAMRSRATQWNSEEVPYGSEMAWDSTGQEGVYYWAKYFGFSNTVTKTVNSVLGYMPTVPHWGWNGNARRYWDNIYGGKLKRIERQIHHYGSGLNSLVLLSAFRSNPSDTYLLQVGYGGASGPLSNINEAGFASASFHSWPDTLKWDGYSGDYGPGFLGLVLGSGTYVAQHASFGLLAYGGVLSSTDNKVNVQINGPVTRRIFIGPLGVTINADAGSISSFSYASSSGAISVVLTQLSGAPKAAAAVLWVDKSGDSASYRVSSPEATRERSGWRIPLTASGNVVVELTRS